MKVDETLNQVIEKYLREKNEEERKLHEPSGKLSASTIAYPLQWQILKTIGVPGKEIDTYTLGVFERGKDVEDWLIERLKPRESQVKVTYRNAVGIIDAYDEIPTEIKSVKNSKFKRIQLQGHADNSNAMQGCFYALATKSKEFKVTYVSADDYRVLTYLYDTDEVKEDVDKAIDEYDMAIKRKIVPVFIPKESWNKMLQYNPYPEWVTLTAEECENKLKTEYPEAYSKMKGELND